MPLPHTFTDGTGQVASGNQVTDNDAYLLAKIEVLEARAGPLGPYSARRVINVGETLTNTSGHREHVLWDVAAASGAVVQIKVGGVNVSQVYVPVEAAAGSVLAGTALRLQGDFIVGPGETFVIEKSGGGGTVEDLHISTRVI